MKVDAEALRKKHVFKAALGREEIDFGLVRTGAHSRLFTALRKRGVVYRLSPGEAERYKTRIHKRFEGAPYGPSPDEAEVYGVRAPFRYEYQGYTQSLTRRFTTDSIIVRFRGGSRNDWYPLY